MKNITNSVFLFAVFMISFCSPLALDMKITRYKLLFIEIGVLLFVIVFALNIFLNSEIILPNTFLVPIFFYLLITLLFYFISKDRLVSRNEIERALLAFFVFLTGSIFFNKNNVKYVLHFIVLSTIFICLYGFVQRQGTFWIFQVPQSYRVMSTFGNADFYGGYLVIVLPIIFSTFLTQKDILKNLSVFAFLLGLLNLYYSASRGAMLGLVITSFFFVYFTIQDKRRKYEIIIFLGLIISVYFFTNMNKYLYGLGGKGLLSKVNEIILKKDGIPLIEKIDNTFGTDRLKIWRDTLKMSVKNPFGVGIGAFHIYFPGYASEDLKVKLPQNKFIVNYAHNEYIEMLSETGFINIGVFIWLNAMIFRFVIESKKKYLAYKISKNIYLLIIGITSGIVAILVHNFFDVNFRFIVNWAYLFFFLSVLSGLFSNGFFINIYHLKNIERFLLIIVLVFTLHFFVKKIIEPYKAHKEISNEVDFFDQKIQNAGTEIEIIKERINKNPKDFEAYQKLAWIYAKEIEITDKNGSKKVNYEMAKLAIDNFINAIKINPNLFGAYNNIGNIFFTLNDRNKAIENYNKSLAINPNQIDARMNLSLAYYYQGRLKEASEQLKYVLKIEPNNSKAIILLKKMVE